MTAYPQNQMVIDCSHYNDVRDWAAVKASGVVGVIHKFSQGASYRDPAYQLHRMGAKAANLLWGRYHFADTSPVASQVSNFLDGWQKDELLAVDWESSENGTMTLDNMEALIGALRQQAPGQIPMLYSSNAVKNALRARPSPILAACRLWLAQYANQPVLPPGWDAPWLWQWTNNGTCGGIVGAVDLDSYMGTEAELRATWIDTTPAPPAVPDVETETVTISIVVPKGARVSVSASGPVDGVTINPNTTLKSNSMPSA